MRKLGLAVVVIGWCGMGVAAGSVGAEYLSQVRGEVARSRGKVGAFTVSAAGAAKAYVGGGNLWAAGRQGDFVEEACGRAGGLMGIMALGNQEPKKGDVVLYGVAGGMKSEDIKKIVGWRKAGVLVVEFGSTAGVFKQHIPIDTVANVVDLWAWTGEFVGACTRLGKMPVLYQSYGVPGGKVRDEKYQGKRFHEDMQIKPVAAGVLGRAYLDRIEGMLTQIERTQGAKIVQAGRWWREVPKGEATTRVIGHMLPGHFLDPRAVQCSDYLTADPWNDQKMVDEARPKKFILYVGYQYAPVKLVEQAKALAGKVKLVYFDVQPARPAEPASNILYINPGWPLSDGCVTVPGYDISVFPASGVINSSLYWAILAEREAKDQPVTDAGKLDWKLVWMWSLPQTTDREVEEFVVRAQSLGFNAVACATPNRKGLVKACEKHHMESYMPIFPGNDRPQKMAEKEGGLPTGRSQYPPYQFGGEPLTGKVGTEILDSSIACFRQPETLAYVKKQIDEALACGFTGVAFDFFGYRNYHSCECELCKSQFKTEAYPGLSREKAWDQFQEDSIVSLYEQATAYGKAKAQSMNRTMKTTCHVYPVFLPDVLYGRRLPVDYCGETVTWFFVPHWSFDKIGRYCDFVVKEQASVHPGSLASPFIAFYSKGENARDVKIPERVRREIEIVKQSGARGIQFAELGHILAVPEVARVVAEELRHP